MIILDNSDGIISRGKAALRPTVRAIGSAALHRLVLIEGIFGVSLREGRHMMFCLEAK